MSKIIIEKQLEKIFKTWIKNEPTLRHLENIDIGEIGWEEEEKMTTNQKEFIASMLKVMVEFQNHSNIEEK